VGTVLTMFTLYSADRCPFAARVRIALAEKGVQYELVEVDLDDRPAWMYDKNPLGKVPVLEEDGFVLPESLVINEYLEERYPDPPLWPADAAERALARLRIEQDFDRLRTAYYGVRRGEDGAHERLDAELGALAALLEAQPFVTGREYGLADIAFVPWILRARSMLGVDLEPFGPVVDWLDTLAERPAIAAELDVVAAL
jgi:glutathione S-transferase